MPSQKFSKEDILKLRIVQMVADGSLSAASATLISQVIAEPTKENLKKLQEKDPFKVTPDEIPIPYDEQPIWITQHICLQKFAFLS